MASNLFRTSLKEKLKARENRAEHIVGDSLVAAGLSVDESRYDLTLPSAFHERSVDS